MAAQRGRRKAAIARVNRRREGQEALGALPFADEMARLAAAKTTAGEYHDRDWFAADMTIDPSGQFLSGILGFEEVEQRTEFDPAEFSWLKGTTTMHEGATTETKVPFAVDLREDRRWVAFGMTRRIGAAAFAAGFEAALNSGVRAEGWPTDWAVDLVLGKARVEQWLEEHPEVREFTRIVKLSNPGREIDEDRQEMHALAARTKKEIFTAPYARNLDARSPVFEEKLEGLETGDLEVILESRGGTTKFFFRSKTHSDEVTVPDFGDDLELGMQYMIEAVRRYSAVKAGEAIGDYTQLVIDREPPPDVADTGQE